MHHRAGSAAVTRSPLFPAARRGLRSGRNTGDLRYMGVHKYWGRSPLQWYGPEKRLTCRYGSGFWVAPHVPSGPIARTTYFPDRVSGPGNLGRVSLRVRVLGRTTATPGKVAIHHISDVTIFRILNVTQNYQNFETVRSFGSHHQHPPERLRGGPFPGQEFRTKS